MATVKAILYVRLNPETDAKLGAELATINAERPRWQRVSKAHLVGELLDEVLAARQARRVAVDAKVKAQLARKRTPVKKAVRK